jgi:hypothetical protein
VRAEVTVNGKVVGAQQADLAVVVLPSEVRQLPDWLKFGAESMWRDGTGTCTVLIDVRELLERIA